MEWAWWSPSDEGVAPPAPMAMAMPEVQTLEVFLGAAFALVGVPFSPAL